MNEHEIDMKKLELFLWKLENYDRLINECQYRIHKEEDKILKHPHMDRDEYYKIHRNILEITEDMRMYTRQKQELCVRV